MEIVSICISLFLSAPSAMRDLFVLWIIGISPLHLHHSIYIRTVSAMVRCLLFKAQKGLTKLKEQGGPVCALDNRHLPIALTPQYIY